MKTKQLKEVDLNYGDKVIIKIHSCASYPYGDSRKCFNKRGIIVFIHGFPNSKTKFIGVCLNRNKNIINKFLEYRLSSMCFWDIEQKVIKLYPETKTASSYYIEGGFEKSSR